MQEVSLTSHNELPLEVLYNAGVVMSNLVAMTQLPFLQHPQIHMHMIVYPSHTCNLAKAIANTA